MTRRLWIGLDHLVGNLNARGLRHRQAMRVEPARERRVTGELRDEDVVVGTRNTVDDVAAAGARDEIGNGAERPGLAVDEVGNALAREVIVVREDPRVAVAGERREQRTSATVSPWVSSQPVNAVSPASWGTRTLLSARATRSTMSRRPVLATR